MSHIKQLQTFIIWFLFSALLLGCNGGGGGGSAAPVVTLDTLSLSTIESTLDINDTLQLTATGEYSDATTKSLSSQVTWKVGNSAIVSVSASGLLRALSAGTTTVTATIDGISSLERSVSVRALASLNISPSSLTLAINSSQALSVTGIYTDNSTEALGEQVTWSTENDVIASVSSSGIVTANTAGTVDITATLGAISRDVSLTVSPATLQSISISAAESQVTAGLSTQFTATGLYSDGTQQNLSDQVVWAVSDSLRANIEPATGLLTGLQAGSLSVSATKEGLTDSLSFTISPATLSSLQVTPSTLNLAKGTVQSVTVTAIFSDLSKQDVSTQVSWSSSDAARAIVTEGSSIIEALDEGAVTFTASLAGEQANLAVNISSAELVSLSLSPANAVLPLGVSQQFVAQGTYTDGSVQDLSAQVTWLSSNEATALISNNASLQGKAESKALGTTTISAVFGELEQTTTLTVENTQLTSIEVQPSNQTLAVGTDARISAIGNYSGGARFDITSVVNWNANTTNLINLSQAANGTIKTLEQGDALINAELEGVTSLANIRVTNATLGSITIETARTTLASGTRLNLIARGHYSDASSKDISAQVTWQSSHIEVLAVANSNDEFGLITGLSPGQATITASLGPVSDQQSITVSDAVLESLLISSPSNSLNVNSSMQLSAQATFSDDSIQDVTRQVNWLSSQVNIASVDNTRSNKGRVNAFAFGQAQISASLNGIQSNALAVNVTQNANAPISLNLSAQPNAILNNGTDASQVSIKVIPALPSGDIADGTLVSLTITEGETERTENLVTTNGLANYTLTSDYQGVVGLTATLGELSGNSALLSSTELRHALFAKGAGSVTYENNILESGSVFILLLRNLSNRVFNVEEISIQYIDPNNGDAITPFPESPFSDAEFTSDGNLTAGEFTYVGYELDYDIEARLYQIIYTLSDDATASVFTLGLEFDFGAL